MIAVARSVHWPVAWSWWSAWQPAESPPAGPRQGGRTACAGRQTSAPSSGWAVSGGSPHQTVTRRHWLCEPGGLSTAKKKKWTVTSNTEQHFFFNNTRKLWEKKSLSFIQYQIHTIHYAFTYTSLIHFKKKREKKRTHFDFNSTQYTDYNF